MYALSASGLVYCVCTTNNVKLTFNASFLQIRAHIDHSPMETPADSSRFVFAFHTCVRVHNSWYLVCVLTSFNFCLLIFCLSFSTSFWFTPAPLPFLPTHPPYPSWLELQCLQCLWCVCSGRFSVVSPSWHHKCRDSAQGQREAEIQSKYAVQNVSWAWQEVMG